jgi:DNA repair protein RecO (recombination protein O)
MTHKTRAIVLRTIKYGETSLVVTAFTELFGVQTYMVNGVRSNKKGSARATLLQPAAILDLVVYHHVSKSMQRIKEFEWAFLYQSVLGDVVRNNIAAYMMELLYRCLKQPEPNSDLFLFCEEALTELDAESRYVCANFPLFFTLNLAHFFGFRIAANHSATNHILDLEEGMFITERPTHPNFLEGEEAIITAQLLRVMQPHELEEIKLNREMRRKLLIKYLEYYALHISEFGQMKTLTVLHEVL